MHLSPLLPLLLAVAGPVLPSRGREAAPLAHTYSIVARDSVTGEIGVAVQSHYFSVGPVVPWAEAGVGAVATQALVLSAYGPMGLDLMRQGLSAPLATTAPFQLFRASSRRRTSATLVLTRIDVP